MSEIQPCLIDMIRVNNGLHLSAIRCQAIPICIAAVRYNGFALKYVEQQTDEICLAAVKRYGAALKYVQKQSFEICAEAIKESGFSFEYVHEDPTGELRKLAVKVTNGNILFFLSSPESKKTKDHV